MSRRFVVFAALFLLFFSGAGFLPGAESCARTPDGKDKGAGIYDYEIRIGWGGYPLADGRFFFDSFPLFMKYNDMNYYIPSSMKDIYRDYRGPAYMTGLISAEIDINFKRWFALTVGLGFNGIFQNVYDPMTGRRAGQNSGISVSILPEARFNWLNRDMVRMYSAIGLGLTLGSMTERDFGYTDLMLYPVVQVTPVGISVGRRVYGFAEAGIGTQFLGGMAGVGVRF